jgi:hypothetical protein
MVRYFCAFLALLIGLGLSPASAERWLRVMQKDPTHDRKNDAYHWFDVDTIVRDGKTGFVVARVSFVPVKAVRAGSVGGWTLWAVDCKAQKAYTVGTAGADGKLAKTTNWRTDPKTLVTLGTPKADPVVAAVATRVCSWIDVWPPGAIP